MPFFDFLDRSLTEFPKSAVRTRFAGALPELRDSAWRTNASQGDCRAPPHHEVVMAKECEQDVLRIRVTDLTDGVNYIADDVAGTIRVFGNIEHDANRGQKAMATDQI